MNKKITIIILSVTIIFVSIVGIWFYTNNRNSQKVADSVNKNVDILNTNAEENKKILNSISSDFSEIEKSPENTQIQQKINDIKSKTQELKNLSQKTSDNVNKLNKGPNEDTAKIYEKSKFSLETRSKALQNISTLIESPICLIEKISAYTLNFQQAENYLNQVSSEKDNIQNIELSNKAADSFDAGSNSITDLNVCLTSELANYNTQGLKDDLAKDQKLYKSFSSNIRLLSDGLAQNDIAKINSARSGLAKFNEQKTVLFDNVDLNKALEEFPNKSKEITAQVDNQEKDLNNILSEVRKKYNFETQ